jgi:hypothetical protein
LFQNLSDPYLSFSDFFSGLEYFFTMTKQNLYLNEPQYLCDVCNIAVTNPLCPECLAIEVDAWLTMYPDLRKNILPRLKRFIENVNEKAIDFTQCIKCGNKTASLCPYCFTEAVLRELKKLQVNKLVLTEFFEFFNFDFEHTGYSIEAEEMGVI